MEVGNVGFFGVELGGVDVIFCNGVDEGFVVVSVCCDGLVLFFKLVGDVGVFI